MTTTTRPGELTLEEFLKNAEEGVLDDRIEAFMPPEMYGPPTSAERAAARRTGRARATRGDGKVASRRAGKRG